MISWHKVGQHVVCTCTLSNAQSQLAFESVGVRFPVIGKEYIIGGVQYVDKWTGTDAPPGVAFRIGGLGLSWFDSNLFQPVYPQALEDLRRLTQPSPDLVERELVDELRRDVEEHLFRRYGVPAHAR